MICVHWSSPLEVRKKNNGNELITITVDTINYENCKKKKIHLQFLQLAKLNLKSFGVILKSAGLLGSW